MTRAYPSRPLYREPPPAQRRHGLWVAGAGACVKKPIDTVRDRRLTGYGVVLVDQGEGSFSSRTSGVLAVQATSALWLFPEISHGYGPTPRWRERWLLFDGPLAAHMQREGWLDPGQPVTPLGANAQALAAFDRSWDAYQAGGPFAVALATAALTEFILRVAAFSQAAREAQDRLTLRAREILDKEGLQNISPAELAARLGVPHSTLRRRFRKATGFSVRDYGIGVKLKRAKELLVKNEHTIAEIAEQCGFEDPFYFARLFKRRVGISPREFRRVGHI